MKRIGIGFIRRLEKKENNEEFILKRGSSLTKLKSDVKDII